MATLWLYIHGQTLFKHTVVLVSYLHDRLLKTKQTLWYPGTTGRHSCAHFLKQSCAYLWIVQATRSPVTHST